jgi:hypothetical protein
MRSTSSSVISSPVRSQSGVVRAAGLEIGGDAGRPGHVAAGFAFQPGLGGSDMMGVDAMHRQPVRIQVLPAARRKKGVLS